MDDYQQHPEFQALVRAVVVDPGDGTAAGALADWLDEHDQPELATLFRSGLMNRLLLLRSAAGRVADAVVGAMTRATQLLASAMVAATEHLAAGAEPKSSDDPQ